MCALVEKIDALTHVVSALESNVCAQADPVKAHGNMLTHLQAEIQDKTNSCSRALSEGYDPYHRGLVGRERAK
jgi:hypothetical protein